MTREYITVKDKQSFFAYTPADYGGFHPSYRIKQRKIAYDGWYKSVICV